MSLLESKDILKNIQANIIIEQAESYTRQHKNCPYCDQKQKSKGYHLIKYRTLFGVVSIPNLRVHKCHCHESQTASISVLNEWLPEHISPELKYIETKWSALMSYGQTAKLLHDLLPISDTENATTIRRHL